MGDKEIARIEAKTAGYLGQNAARPTDRPQIPVGPKVNPADRALGYALLRESLRNDPPKKEGDK